MKLVDLDLAVAGPTLCTKHFTIILYFATQCSKHRNIYTNDKHSKKIKTT